MQFFRVYLLLSAFFLAAAIFPLAAEAGETGAVLLPAGTKVSFALAEGLSSKHSKKGAAVSFKVAMPVHGKIGNTLVPSGNRVEGEILRIRRSGMFSQPGLVEVGNLWVQAFDNQYYPLSGKLVVNGRGDQIAAICVAVGLSWPVAFFPGSEAVAAEGMIFSASVAEDCWCRVAGARPVFAETRNSVARQAWEETVALADKGDSESAYKVAVWAYYGIGMHASPVFALKYLEIALDGQLPENLHGPAAILLHRLSGSAMLN